MINVRTITLQSKPSEATLTTCINQLELFKNLIEKFDKIYLQARTSRVVIETVDSAESYKQSLLLIEACKFHNFWGICVPINLYQDPNNIKYAYDLLEEESVFINLISTEDDSMSLYGVKSAAKFIFDASRQDPMHNFRIGASSVKQNKTPFFPFSTAVNNGEFTVGLELIDFFLNVIETYDRQPLSEIRKKLCESLSSELDDLEKICEQLSKEFGLSFGGVDLSIAPYPYPLEDQSVVTLIEKIGNMGRSRGEPIFEFGSNGTYFINAFLTNILKQTALAHGSVGFNGVMYSLLEDTYLGLRYEEEAFDVNLLKFLSTSCGCGVDMMPLDGDTDINTIASIIMDNFTVSSLLQKPLGIRLLPIPDSRIGDRTKFHHLFFTNTKIRSIGSGVTFQNLPTQDSIYKIK